MSPDESRIRNLEDRIEILNTLGKGDSPTARSLTRKLEELINDNQDVNG